MARGASGRDAGGPSKKEAGQSRKAEKNNKQKEDVQKKQQSQEDMEWAAGEKKQSAKASAKQSKAESAQQTKALKQALHEADEASLPSKAPTKQSQNKGSAAPAITRKLDLSALDDFDTKKAISLPAGGKTVSLAATNIDDALDALSLLDNGNGGDKLDRHPERRFKAAYAAFETRRLDELSSDKSLRKQQKIERIRKEFEKHPENPFNQVHALFDSTKEEVGIIRQSEKLKTESRLAK